MSTTSSSPHIRKPNARKMLREHSAGGSAVVLFITLPTPPLLLLLQASPFRDHPPLVAGQQPLPAVGSTPDLTDHATWLSSFFIPFQVAGNMRAQWVAFSEVHTLRG
jgi:hypothetical protein